VSNLREPLDHMTAQVGHLRSLNEAPLQGTVEIPQPKDGFRSECARPRAQERSAAERVGTCDTLAILDAFCLRSDGFR